MKLKGFTLIELMVVIAIIAVLAVIALPAYSDYARKARRSDAKIALTGLAQAQESYHADYPKYASILDAATNYSGGNTLGCRTACVFKSSVAYSPDEHYQLQITSSSASNFVITAAPKTTGPQATDSDCMGFAIDSLGRKSSGTSAGVAVTNLSATSPGARDPKGCW